MRHFGTGQTVSGWVSWSLDWVGNWREFEIDVGMQKKKEETKQTNRANSARRRRKIAILIMEIWIRI